MDHESNIKILFSSAMKGEWSKVIEMYQQDARLHKARITVSGGTALHIAVAEGKVDVVKQMVHVISQKAPNEDERIEALLTHTQRKNTALHVAASMGNSTICHIIASKEPTLVDARNLEGETPLFLAALHGRKQAFQCLHFIRNPHITTPPSYVNCRRNNGDTLLHCAINGDYFDLAFQIVHLYGDLAYSMNEEGLSPLHLLASKRHAFRSGSRLGWMETLIYNCMHVDRLKAKNPAYEHQNAIKDDDSDGYDRPDNYNTLWDVFRLIKKVVTVDAEDHEASAGGSRVDGGQENSLFPANYKACCDLIKFFVLVLLIILGKGPDVRKIYRKKETHTWSVQIVKLILQHASLYEFKHDGYDPSQDATFFSLYKLEHEGHGTTSQEAALATSIEFISTKAKEKRRVASYTWTAVKEGVMEIIENLVELFPEAIQDEDEDKKNIVLLAAEHRQPHVYEFLLKKNIYKESLFHQVDQDGNTALHLAAKLDAHKPWLITGEALQMQWELKWYKFVKNSMPVGFIRPYNKKRETADEIFTRTHDELVKSGGEWVRRTSESCSVVAALVATVAFATATAVPGGVNQDSGYPTLEKERAFNVFADSSLIALCCSIMAVVTFLSLLTSRFQEQDFAKDLPMKLLVGLTLLLMSIASMLVSFCAGHFFVLKHQVHHAAFSLYAVTCLSVIFYVLSQFPVYFDYLRATFIRVPQRA